MRAPVIVPLPAPSYTTPAWAYDGGSFVPYADIAPGPRQLDMRSMPIDLRRRTASSLAKYTHPIAPHGRRGTEYTVSPLLHPPASYGIAEPTGRTGSNDWTGPPWLDKVVQSLAWQHTPVTFEQGENR